MVTIISLILYIGTFLLGFVLNKRPDNSREKWFFTVWLYIFLCFGYMTGSDWRSYEITYHNYASYGIEANNQVGENGFAAVFAFLSALIKDFFISFALLKCLYLYSLIRLLKVYSKDWLLTTVILMPISLLFMLIDNPLRFMCALILVNIALVYNYHGKQFLTYVLLIIAVTFHTASVFFVMMPIALKIAPKLFFVNRWILLISFILVFYISSNIELINSIKNSTLGFIMQYMEMKDYTKSYTADNNEAFFTIGSFLQMFFFCIILLSKKYIDKNNRSLISLYGITILYFFLGRILLLMPTGFRLAIPFGYFYALYIANLFVRKKMLSYVICLYLCMVMFRTLYSGYSYIPYTNSIPYIITQDHLNYSYRCQYNINAHYKRTGEYLKND